jgi:hypothetical protein
MDDVEVTELSDGRWTGRRVDSERCDRIAALLLTARGLLGDYLSLDPDWVGLPGSQLDAERSEFQAVGNEVFSGEVQAAVNNAGLLVFAGVQHVECIAALLKADVPPIYSLTALARAAMELCAGAWRLTDATIDARMRVSRLSLDRLNSARELEKLLGEIEANRDEFGGHASLDDTARVIEALGLVVKVGGRSSAGDTVDGHGRPSITTTMESFAGRHIATDSRRIYRLFSAVAHGSQWGVTIFFGPGDVVDGRLSAEYRVDQGWIDGVSLVAAESFAWAVENFVILLGWDERPLLKWMSEIDAIFGIVET